MKFYFFNKEWLKVKLSMTENASKAFLDFYFYFLIYVEGLAFKRQGGWPKL